VAASRCLGMNVATAWSVVNATHRLVRSATHADDGHVELVALHLGHAADGPLGHAPLAYEAVHTRDDLGTVRQRHGSRVELLEVAQAQVHGGQSTSS
jgi:hypothetical protein